MQTEHTITFSVKNGKQIMKLTLSYDGEVHELNRVANVVFYRLRGDYPQAMIHRGATTIAEVIDESFD